MVIFVCHLTNCDAYLVVIIKCRVYSSAYFSIIQSKEYDLYEKSAKLTRKIKICFRFIGCIHDLRTAVYHIEH